MRNTEPVRRARAALAAGPTVSSRIRHGGMRRTTSSSTSPTRIRVPGVVGTSPWEIVTFRRVPAGSIGAPSNVNRALVDRLTAEGLMTPAGQAAIDLAKRTGTWALLADAQDGVVPDDLREALAADPAAAAHFTAFPPSTRRAILESLARAKRPETRRRRIARAVERAARNERP